MLIEAEIGKRIKAAIPKDISPKSKNLIKPHLSPL
jgi:hypothetical protein